MNSYNLINAKFITMDEQMPFASCLTIHNGKIESVNSINNNYKSIDLNSKIVIPGFIDAHYHLKNYGKRLNQLDLKNSKSISQIVELIQAHIKTINKGEWVLGFGWDQNLWNEQDFPSNKILDQHFPDNPIYLTRIDGHSAWVNKLAILKTGFTEESISNIDGGKVINHCIMIDNTMSPFLSVLPKDSLANVTSWIKKATENTIKKGITGVHDAWQDKNTVLAIQDLIKNNQFPLRCYGMLASSDDDLIDSFFNSGHYSDDYLSIRSVKAFIDGALGSRGAALHEPYHDDHHNCGLILISSEKFTKLAQKCYDANFQLNTHAIGDRGNDYVLNTYGNVLPKDNDSRWRIEHAQMVSDKDIVRFADHNILPSMQPSHCTSDMKWLKDRLGEHRLSLISRWQTFINHGLKIPGGSDCPIEVGNPIFEFYAAVTRQDHAGWPKGGWQPQEKINRLNALKMFTKWAAYGGFQEHRRGMLRKNYDADLTVLSKNILEVNHEEILSTRIVHTIVNGQFVYTNN